MTEENNKNILLAEDNLVTQKLLSSLLKHWGYNVTVVSNGIEVLEKLKVESFDLLILDYQMPEMDGYETLVAIQGDANLTINQMPVVFLTGEISTETLHKLQESGVTCFLRKPIQHEVLSQTLYQLLKNDAPSRRKGTASTKYLRKITHANKSLMIELIDVFIEEAPVNFQKMKSFCLVEDWQKLKTLVHKIKANYIYVGITGHEQLLGDLEIDLERNNYPETYLAKIIELENITVKAISSLKKKKMMILDKLHA